MSAGHCSTWTFLTKTDGGVGIKGLSSSLLLSTHSAAGFHTEFLPPLPPPHFWGAIVGFGG